MSSPNHHIVFNIANRCSAIRAKVPSLRILGVNVSFDEANRIANENLNETRIWQISSASVQNWRVISNTDLGLDYDNVKSVLDAEYASIPTRYEEWVAWRNQQISSTLEAARSQIKRSASQVRATALLSTARSDTSILTHVLNSVRQGPKNEVPTLSRSQELRGQSWAILGIVGDASYEIKKSEILNDIGRRYFQEMHSAICAAEPAKLELGSAKLEPPNAKPSDDKLERECPPEMDPFLVENEDTIEYWFFKLNLSLPQSFLTWIEYKKAELENLSIEPMIAIFDASEDPESLVKKSEILAQNIALKHVSLAVVRMYSWLKTDALENSNISRSPRDASSASFFKAMQEAQTYDSNVSNDSNVSKSE